MKYLIRTQHISKSFFANKVLHDINLKIRPRTFYALLGENGAGKSTLLRILMGAERSDSGYGEILGNQLLEKRHAVNTKIGYVSETMEFDVPTTMDKFISSYKKYYPRWNEKLFQKMVVDQNFQLNKKFKDYSRGQKMQLALMLALAINPKILLVDEVTSVLDIYSRRYFVGLMHEFVKGGGTVVITTNVISEVQEFATHLLLLRQGKIKMDAPIDDIPKKFIKLKKKKNYQHKIFEDPYCYFAGHTDKEVISYIIPEETFKKYQVPQYIIDKAPPRLEDIFIYYFNFPLEELNERIA